MMYVSDTRKSDTVFMRGFDYDKHSFLYRPPYAITTQHLYHWDCRLYDVLFKEKNCCLSFHISSNPKVFNMLKEIVL